MDSICENEHGCCFIQRTLDKFANEPFGKILISRILINVFNFIKHIYANYVIHYIILLDDPVYNTYILNQVKDDILELAIKKHSSKVIETLLQKNPELRKEIINELSNEENKIRNMILNKYGNFGK